MKIHKQPTFNFWKYWVFAAALSLFIALLMHVPNFSQLPSGLNRDEAALGYNAFSILKTGRDEWSEFLPLSFASFGDQKLPGYIYTLVPFISLLGLEIWVVRLPSLLSGLVVITSVGLIAVKLLESMNYSKKQRLFVSFLTMIFIAISPWGMHFSRVAYETHLAMAFFTSGLATFLFSLDRLKKTHQRSLMIASGILFGLSIITYHSYQIFLPLFLLSLTIFFTKKIKKVDRVGIFLGSFFILFSVLLLISGGVIQANKIKSEGTSALSKNVLLSKATEYRVVDGYSPIANKILFNKFGEGVITFAENYLSTISGTFFFSHGSNHGDHNPGNGNNTHIFLAPLILFGVVFLAKNYKFTSAKLIIAWTILALIPSSITHNPLLEVRIATVFPALELIAALGFFSIFNIITYRKKLILSIILITTALYFSLRLFIFYNYISPKSAVDNSNYHLLAKAINKYKSQSGAVLTQSPSSSPYIWYLFENKVDPKLTQESMLHYPATNEGFIHVKQIQNIHFETISWDDLSISAQDKPYTLILKPDEFSIEEFENNPIFEYLESIKDKNNIEIYHVWIINNS